MQGSNVKIADLHLHSRFTDIGRVNKLLSDISELGFDGVKLMFSPDHKINYDFVTTAINELKNIRR